MQMHKMLLKKYRTSSIILCTSPLYNNYVGSGFCRRKGGKKFDRFLAVKYCTQIGPENEATI